MMGMLEAAVELFYDPYIYWGLPLLWAVILEVASRLPPPGSRRR